MRRLPVISALLTALVACALAAGSAHAAAADPAAAGERAGNGFVKHTEQYWVWFGPRNWIASSGAYGISIGDPRGRLGIDYGGSSILCDGPPAQHFKNVRNGLKNQPGIKRGKVTRSRFEQSNGTFFNNFLLSGVGQNGPFKADIRLAYSSYDGTYCFSSGLTKAAPARGFNNSIRTLNAITRTIAYNGPGLPLNPGTGLP